MIWVFDLDNTLHDATPHIFPQVNLGMTSYLEVHLGVDREEADRLRRHYWTRYGATLQGMIRHHGTDPHHFLEKTHDFQDLSTMVVRNPGLRSALNKIRGEKVIFTNAPLFYAQEVLKILGIDDLFRAVYSIEHSGFRPKPDPHGFRRIFRKAGISPSKAIMVEDTLENLKAAKSLGMKTVWISASGKRPSYVDLVAPSIRDLARRQYQLMN